ncbi:MAG: RimK family alpha-L-glutamate ligase [Planctomycetota bacterium]
MAKLAVFVERYTLKTASELNALLRFREAADALGHELDFLFRLELHRLPRYDGILLRALTDPMNTTYVAARSAQLLGKRVIDDPESILICCDKVHMYRRLLRHGVRIPATQFVDRADVTAETGARLLDELGCPLVLKAPNSSFSKYVEKVADPAAFVRVGTRFLRRADRIVVQEFVPSKFDWRVTTLGGRVLFCCRYVMAQNCWRIRERDAAGHVIECQVQAVELDQAPPKLLEVALDASRAIGGGLYGVDLKQIGSEFVVIEVNDNPNIDAGYEDLQNPRVYRDVLGFLAGEWGAAARPSPELIASP